MKNIILIFVISNITFFSISQAEKVSARKNEFGIHFGFNSYTTQIMNVSWNLFDPQFTDPSQSDTNFRSYSFPYFNNYAFYSLNYAQIIPLRKLKHSLAVTLILNNSEGLNFQQNWSKTSKSRIDTLKSSNSSDQFYVDSVANHNISNQYSSRVCRLNFGAQWRYQLTNRFTFLAGIDLGFGIGNQVRYSSSIYTYSYKQISDTSENNIIYQNYYDYKTGDFTDKKIKQQSNYNFNLNAPIGFSYCLSKKENKFADFYINYTFNIGYNYFVIPKQNIQQSQTYFRNTIGLTYRF